MNRQSVLNLPRGTRDTLFMLLVIAWVILPLLGQLPLWCSALAAAMMLWRGVLAWRGQPLPANGWRLGLLALATVATLLTYKTLLGRDAGVTLVVVLLALKTLELRARRDAFVVFFLSFFLMLTNFFYSQSLLTAAAMLMALLGLLTALVNAHMPVGRPPLLRAMRVAAGMTLLGAPVMVVVFVLFPRVAPLWGMPSDAMAGRSGLSTEMAVGNIATLALDDSVAMRIQFEGDTPAQTDLYFRGPVLTRFDGQRWWPSDDRMALLRARDAALQVQEPGIRYQVTLEPNQQPWLLTLDATPNAPVIAQGHARMTSELQWLQDRNVTELLRYSATSFVHFSHGPRRFTPQLARYLALPEGYNPRTLAWAQQLQRAAPVGQASDEHIVQQALERLRSGGYTYTLEPGSYGRDTADEFWFDRKAGFCEHIASGFVILMRAAGVPARVVTGYQGGARNPVDGVWMVRQSDAHAWAEVWLNGQGWVRVDPTGVVAPSRTGSLTRLQAPRGMIANALLGDISVELALQLRATWEALNNRWNQAVLNFSQSSQLSLLRDIGFKAPSWEDLIYLLCAMVVTASLLVALWGSWVRQRQDPWLRLLAKAAQRLQVAGLTIASHSTPRQLAHALEETPRGVAAQFDAPAWRDWLLRLEALRYSAHGSRSKADFRRRLATLQRELKHLRTAP